MGHGAWRREKEGETDWETRGLRDGGTERRRERNSFYVEAGKH